jgi:hypothetical protein
LEGIEDSLLLQPIGSRTFLDRTSTSANEILIAQGTDGYEVIYALAEIDPDSGAIPTTGLGAIRRRTARIKP